MKGVHYARPCLNPSVQAYEPRVGDLAGSSVCLAMQLTAVSGRLLTFKHPIQGFTLLHSLAHLDVEYLFPVHGTREIAHLVTVVGLSPPLHTASPNLG